ncbi:28S ribosomal protein S29, mitochondrial isoform X2 [Toxorhynchites rutilus septentrionalis]|uniref:28S ribosomal protein S29, mitochondrial isoform X2 n=1 Tax=Toxorhynchites rutilus septentrionalis TaxID=329112 RepID=UPI0024796FD9|nr:28S ribosomal protein S29, mitochondrial isoform X2 [Toxorhynchites rutilus septentrionalis]
MFLFMGRISAATMFLRRTSCSLFRTSSVGSVSMLSTATARPAFILEDFRTSESNSTKHNKSHLSRYYSIPIEHQKRIFTYGGFPKTFQKQIKTFNEASIMVRKPAVEIINYLNCTDFKQPANRYVLYGNDGTGKSMILAHLLHYGFTQQFVLVHVPWVPNWMKRVKEVANSTTHEGCLDLPLDGAAWLAHFKHQNAQLLSKLNLTVSKDYFWSKRETTLAGANLMDLVDHGINRAKFSCDAIAALLQELKQQSTQGKVKTMVIIDGYNAFFHPHTRIFTENKVRVTPDKLTITQPFLDITNHDWSNGVCIIAVDKMALTDDHMESELPMYLLRRKGFEHLDPFVPIRVDNYSEEEFHSCVQYYLNRKWIQTTTDGFDKELEFLSGKNPYKIMQLCASL